MPDLDENYKEGLQRQAPKACRGRPSATDQARTPRQLRQTATGPHRSSARGSRLSKTRSIRQQERDASDRFDDANRIDLYGILQKYRRVNDFHRQNAERSRCHADHNMRPKPCRPIRHSRSKPIAAPKIDASRSLAVTGNWTYVGWPNSWRSCCMSNPGCPTQRDRDGRVPQALRVPRLCGVLTFRPWGVGLFACKRHLRRYPPLPQRTILGGMHGCA